MSEKCYNLPDGSQLIVTEERCLFARSSAGAIPISIDADNILDDVLELVDHLKEETKDYAALIARHHAEESRFLQMRSEVANLRKALEDVQSHLEQQRYYSALKTVENALLY